MDINIAVIGKTGVGKSSFCNYIFGQDFIKTGCGKPVTGWEDNFSLVSTQYKGYKLNVFDSVGLEPDNLEKWSYEFQSFMDQRLISTNIKHDLWLHGVFYLLNAASARIESVELKIINEVRRRGIPLIIILTNIDIATVIQISELEKIILVNFRGVAVAKVCSVEKKTRVGLTFKSGKSEVLDLYFKNLYEDICYSILFCMVKDFEALAEKLYFELREKIEKMDLGIITLAKSAMNDSVPYNEKDFDVFDQVYSTYMSEVESINCFVSSLGGAQDKSIITEFESFMGKIENQIELAVEEFLEEYDKIIAGVDSDKTFTVIKSISKGLFEISRLKSRVLDKLFETYRLLDAIICEEIERIKKNKRIFV